MKNSNETIGEGGWEYTSDSFLLGKLIFIRKNNTVYKTIPTAVVQTSFSTYYAYDIEECKMKEIPSFIYYNTLKTFERKGGINKAMERYMYDKINNDDFVLYCLLTSCYM